MSPSVEQFRALARSSPWRWQTLRFVEAVDEAMPEELFDAAHPRR